MVGGALAGILIDGRYRVGPVIGVGGFGTVYSAVHVGLAGKVALKVPHVDGLAPSDASGLIAAFLEEGRLIKRLRHPNIVAALDVGLLPADGATTPVPYLVMEWCEGVTLRDWLASAGPLCREDAWSLLRPAFDAIGHAHEHGIAHRDIKPANILLEEVRPGQLVPRVIDFGVAKTVVLPLPESSGHTRTTSDSPAYTPRYAAPEQLIGLRSGPASDVYALALVLLETLLGRPVFETNEAARAAIADRDLPTSRKLGADLGPWNEVLDKALSWRASDRQPDANALVEALDEDVEPRSRRPLGLPRSLPAPSSMPPGRVSSIAPPSSDQAVSRTAQTGAAQTGAARGMAYDLVEIGGRRVHVALHTRDAPSDVEWLGWTRFLEDSARSTGWDLASTPNLVVTDGGAPSTAQRTIVNVLIAQAKTLPAVALVTRSSIVRAMVRAFSIFNPRVRVFSPDQMVAAAEHVGLGRPDLPVLMARCRDLEAEVLGEGAVETLRALDPGHG